MGKIKLVIGCLLLALLTAAVAAAAEPGEERQLYVDRLEPICKANVLANKRIFKGAKEEVQRGELKKASTHFFRAATAFGKTIRQLAAVPKPPADEAKLDKWFELLRVEKELIQKIGRALGAGNKSRAQTYSVELNRNSSKANNAVLSFGFDYCRLEPSRFG